MAGSEKRSLVEKLAQLRYQASDPSGTPWIRSDAAKWLTSHGSSVTPAQPG